MERIVCAVVAFSAHAGVLAERLIATGVYVQAFSGDDSYTGQARFEFLLFLKGLLPAVAYNETTFSQLPRTARVCPDDVLTTNRTFEDATEVILTNAVDHGNWKNKCPHAADPPLGFTCYYVSGNFRYTPETAMFPFETQHFEIVVEDNGNPVPEGTSFCIVPSMTGFSPKFTNVRWDEDPKMNYQIEARCYFPGCSSGRKGLTIFIDVERPWRKMILRYFISPSLVMFLTMWQYCLHPVEHGTARFSGTAAYLFVLVTFHVSATNSAFQRNSGFSIFDGYVLFAYTIILVASVDNATYLYKRIAETRRRDPGTEEGVAFLKYQEPKRSKVYLRLNMDTAVQHCLIFCTILNTVGLMLFGGQFSLFCSVFCFILVFCVIHLMLKWHKKFEVRLQSPFQWLPVLFSRNTPNQQNDEERNTSVARMSGTSLADFH